MIQEDAIDNEEALNKPVKTVQTEVLAVNKTNQSQKTIGEAIKNSKSEVLSVDEMATPSIPTNQIEEVTAANTIYKNETDVGKALPAKSESGLQESATTKQPNATAVSYSDKGDQSTEKQTILSAANIDTAVAETIVNPLPPVMDTSTVAQPSNQKFGENATVKPEAQFPNKGKFGIGAYFAPTLTATYLRGDMISGLINTTPVFLYSSNYGLELKYYISNKWAIVSGVGQSDIRSWSKSSVDFSYNADTEHIMETGEKENTSAIPMPTPFGSIDTEVTYRFSADENIASGEQMQSELETHQRILYISIPIGVAYSLINYVKLDWLAEAGIGYNRSVLDGSEFTSRIIHLGDEMKVMGEEMTSHPNYRTSYFNYYVGTGINYRISDHFQFNAVARYMGNIDQVNLQDNMTTNVHVLQLKLGFNYFF